jgi:hypothetical protein
MFGRSSSVDDAMAWQAFVSAFWSKYGKKAALWLIKQIGGQKVLEIVEGQLKGLVARNRAINKAGQVREGRWGPILVEDKARFVVYSGDAPVEIFPAPKGNLAEITAAYNTDLLRAPNDVPSAAFKRWVGSQWKRLRRDVKEGIENPTPAPPAVRDVREAISKSGEEGGQALFHAMVDQLPELLDTLTNTKAATVASHNGIPEAPGIYLFSEGVNPVYVGQTRNLRARLRQQTSPSSRENQAALAWRIALKDAADAGHPITATRKDLEADEVFAEHFRKAKKRVAGMDVRFIELDDPVKRTVFEVYAARALGTDEFNSWETH